MTDTNTLEVYDFDDLNHEDFKDNYDFITGQNEAGEYFAHRPTTPGFLIFESTEEKAVEAAKDVIASYIRHFILKSEPTNKTHQLASNTVSCKGAHTVKLKDSNLKNIIAA